MRSDGRWPCLPQDDLGMVEERLSQGDIAAIIAEPSGGSWGQIPMEEAFLQDLREIATRTNTILIFDEVITGFRWSPGGAQGRFGITPDMTTMAKILAGGFPGGAVAGRADIMEGLIFKDEPGWNANKKVIHPGTYNGNPVAATAGYTCLGICANPEIQIYCDDLTTKLRAGINTVLENRGIAGCAWGESSVWHVILGYDVPNRTAGDLRAPEGHSDRCAQGQWQGWAQYSAGDRDGDRRSGSLQRRRLAEHRAHREGHRLHDRCVRQVADTACRRTASCNPARTGRGGAVMNWSRPFFWPPAVREQEFPPFRLPERQARDGRIPRVSRAERSGLFQA